MRLNLKNQTGDTIVEVLIAIAVVGLVLTGAYRVATHSLNDVRQSQEHTAALKYVQGQLEQLQAASSNPANGIFQTPNPVPSPFCVDGSGTVGSPCSISSSGAFNYTISDTRTGSSPNFSFTVQVTWPGIQGGTDQESLSYNLDKPS